MRTAHKKKRTHKDNVIEGDQSDVRTKKGVENCKMNTFSLFRTNAIDQTVQTTIGSLFGSRNSTELWADLNRMNELASNWARRWLMENPFYGCLPVGYWMPSFTVSMDVHSFVCSILLFIIIVILKCVLLITNNSNKYTNRLLLEWETEKRANESIAWIVEQRLRRQSHIYVYICGCIKRF